MARIIIIGPEGRQERVLVAHNTLGRHPDNTHQVLDRIVSKEHCHIDLEDGRFILKDLGSLNGTFVNGERVDNRVLSGGDEITMGSTRILFTAARRWRPSFAGGEPANYARPDEDRPRRGRPGSPDPDAARRAGVHGDHLPWNGRESHSVEARAAP